MSDDTEPLPSMLVTAVGSLPHLNAGQAVQLILDTLRDAPHAPQLPRMDPREQMWIQFTEYLPRFRVDLANMRYFFDTSGDPFAEIEEFYHLYLKVIEGGTPDAFAIGPEFGKGIGHLLTRLQQEGLRFPFLKVQVTGPLSFALTVPDETGKPVFYHSVFRDIAVKGMGLKAVWLLEQFKHFAERIIIFFDEPSLSAYGSSAMLGVSAGDVVESLNDVIQMVLDRGGIPGIHCCGNTDWSLVVKTATRIVNFDAVDYMDSLALYSTDLQSFLDRGGLIAWGAVPNTAQAETETAADVVKRIREGMKLLEGSGVDRSLLRRRLMITPACGCAGLNEFQAGYVYRLLSELEKTAPVEIFQA